MPVGGIEAIGGTSAGDAEKRLMGTGGASPIHGAINARAKISPKPSMTPLRNGRPMLMASVAVTSRRRRDHGTPGAHIAAIVSSPVGAGGSAGSATLAASSIVERPLSIEGERCRSLPGAGAPMGAALSSIGAALSSTGTALSSIGTALSSIGTALSSIGTALSSIGTALSSIGISFSPMGASLASSKGAQPGCFSMPSHG